VGKFDQCKRDIPYATLAQAFQSLVRPLLGKSDTELNSWRDAFLDALAPNGRLILDVVPSRSSSSENSHRSLSFHAMAESAEQLGDQVAAQRKRPAWPARTLSAPVKLAKDSR
jgi:predicted ATPase